MTHASNRRTSLSQASDAARNVTPLPAPGHCIFCSDTGPQLHQHLGHAVCRACLTDLAERFGHAEPKAR